MTLIEHYSQLFHAKYFYPTEENKDDELFKTMNKHFAELVELEKEYKKKIQEKEEEINRVVESFDFNMGDIEVTRLTSLSGRIDSKTLLLFWQFSIETMTELNLVSNQNLSIEMFLIRLMYIKDENSSYMEIPKKIDTNNIETKFPNENNNDSPKNVNQAVNQIKFSTQEVQDHLIKDEKLNKKYEIKSFEDLLDVCKTKKELELKFELENNVNLVSFQDKKIEISFNENLNKNFIKNISEKLLEWTGKRWIIMFSKKTGFKSIKQKNKNLEKKYIDDDFAREYSGISPSIAMRKIKKLEKKMYEHASNLEFEEASKIRDEIKKVKEFIFSSNDQETAS